MKIAKGALCCTQKVSADKNIHEIKVTLTNECYMLYDKSMKSDEPRCKTPPRSNADSDKANKQRVAVISMELQCHTLPCLQIASETKYMGDPDITLKR